MYFGEVLVDAVLTPRAGPLGSPKSARRDATNLRANVRIPMRRLLALMTAAALSAAALLGVAQPASAETEITLWSHWAAEKIKRDFVEDAIKRFEDKNPGVKIKASWYEKTALYAALKTALRAGHPPNMFYADPDQVEYIDNGFLLYLSGINW